MGSYRIELRGSAEHDLRKIDKQFIPKIIDAIESLESKPFSSHSRKLAQTESSYRIRVGEYRVIYQVDVDNQIIIISYIRHRKDAYKR